MTPWWHTTTVYQIYPRSFCDSDGDGIGDLRGIIQKLDYIRDLGFETVWISPFYPSPLMDHGYDITDYYGVAPEYGTMDDLAELLEQAHRRNLKVLLDMVLSHTSDQHPWFIESRASRNNPKSDWYIWREGQGNKPPNNWIAMPGGGGWHYVKERDQWYMASFLPFQPDLNWRNPEVKKTMFDMVRYWLGKGVDGFRLDLFTALMKDSQFRNNPLRPGLYSGGRPCLYQPCMQHNHPDIYPFAKELRGVVDEFGDPDRILLGETIGTKPELRQLLGGESNDGLNLVFIFDMVFMHRWQRTAKWFRRLLSAYEHHFPAPFQPTYVYGNHDMRRLMSKIGDDLDLARVLALFQFTARGVPTVYMGEEIGMTDVFIPKAEAQDPISKQWDWVPDFLRAWLPINVNRDMNRTPMQWTNGENAGFCPAGSTPWLPVNNGNKSTRNVATQLADPGSLLNLYKTLLELRRVLPALYAGSLTLLSELPKSILGYRRETGEQRIAVFLNFGRAAMAFPLQGQGKCLFATAQNAKLENATVHLPGKSGMLILHEGEKQPCL